MNFIETVTHYIVVFAVGGALCVVAQILIDKTKLTPARILVAYVTAGVDFAGAGASTPLLGFGNTIARGIREGVDEKGLLGALTGGFTASAAGIAAALVFGYIAAVVFNGKRKK